MIVRSARLFVTMGARRDWQAGKYLPYALIVFLWTSLVVAAYYLNHPQPEPLADSWSYLYVVDQIQHYGRIINFWRLPGYPFFVSIIYALAGEGNLGAVSVAQGVLFILSALELFILGALIFRRIWPAFLLSLFIAADVVLLSSVKPIMSEGIALWLLVTLALAVTLFLHTFRLRFFWPVVLCTLLLFFTRPEWIYLPPFLFAYLLLVALWRGVWRRFLVPTLLALLLLYGSLGGYVLLNAEQNHFTGVTWIENINLLGKVLQYRMVDEAAPQDGQISQTLDAYLREGITDPYIILGEQPVLARNYAARSGEFARTIILHHPLEFLVKSIPVLFASLTAFHLESDVISSGFSGAPLVWLQNRFGGFYAYNVWFPFCAVLWLLLLCSRRMRQHEMVQKMGAVVLLPLYGVIVTVLAGYRNIDYARIYAVLAPLSFLVIWALFQAPFLLLKIEWSRLLPAVVSKRANEEAARVAEQRVRVRQWEDFSVAKKILHLVPLLFLLVFVAGSAEMPAVRASARVIPLSCHAETDTGMVSGDGVGILFIAVENRGQDVGPTTMLVEFKTDSATAPQVSLLVPLPALPAGAYRFIMVDIPRQRNGFLNPVGPVRLAIKITTGSAGRVSNVLVTSC